ncbi:hypothetical protein MLD38_033249 [Melastoma candidum]|uniref:Uncharacterized protein n=1 Tax=Melastoma candidum TaxID=119954 RepID=A0ACB9M7Y6_9MYRT|nr:hypothetical protein MLD38_033249 [Melastoma candidum]
MFIWFSFAFLCSKSGKVPEEEKELAPMAKQFRGFVLFSAMVLFFARPTEQLQSSQAQTLVRIQKLLNYPATQGDAVADFCDSATISSFAVVCYQDSVTQLHVVGDLGAPPLPGGFSMDSFMKTLSRLPSLKVLTLASLGLRGPLPGKIARLSSLEILNVSSNYINGSLPQQLSSMTSLETLVLDQNNFSGPLPGWLGSLPGLTVLSARVNSFGQSLPSSISHLENLRVLALSANQFVGTVPDLRSLTNLQVLDLEDNEFSGKFPQLSNRLTVLILRKNKFRSGAPAGLTSYFQLQHLDLSGNSFVGPFPQSLFSLPSITYLNIAENKFTGLLSENQSCCDSLAYVNISTNLLTGKLPNCLSDSTKREAAYAGNCMVGGVQNQEPASFCLNEAIAVGIVPGRKKARSSLRTVTGLSIAGGTLGGIILIGAIFWAVKRSRAKRMTKLPRTRLIYENASTGYTSKMITDARYISQTMKLGALGLPAYRTFALEEIEEATWNFDSSTSINDGSDGQMYRGQLKNGLIVTIGCLNVRKRRSISHYMPYIELISKFRHPHVVSVLGHCFECYWDDSSVSRIFLVFEYVSNGNLRSWISGQHRQPLAWSQRITAAIGVARGIQYLHTRGVPGLYSNKLKTTDVLLDQNLLVKISSYNLPLLAEELVKGKDGNKLISGGMKDNAASWERNHDKTDIYDFGVILLEILTGRSFQSQRDVDLIKDQLQPAVVGSDEAARRGMIDPLIQTTCTDQSIRTMTEICTRCLNGKPAERPSMEDVIWNLQFAAQVQEAWRGDSQSSDGSPQVSFTSPTRTHHHRLE